MRPHRIFTSTLSLSITSVNDIDLVDITISIPVIIGKVNLTICHLNSLTHHSRRRLIIVILIIATIISHLLTYGKWSYNIEIDGQQAIALGQEVITHRATVPISTVPHLVELVVKLCLGMLHIHILKVYQDDKTFFLATDVLALQPPFGTTLNLTLALGLDTTSGLNSLGRHFGIGALDITSEHGAIGGHIVMGVLVTLQGHLTNSPVAECNRFTYSLGWYSHHACHT